MRRDGFKIEFDTFPHASRVFASEVRKIMQYAYSFGYAVRMVDPKTGMIQFENSTETFKMNFYTTTFTVALIRSGKQKFDKKIPREKIKGYLMDNA